MPAKRLAGDGIFLAGDLAQPDRLAEVAGAPEAGAARPSARLLTLGRGTVFTGGGGGGMPVISRSSREMSRCSSASISAKRRTSGLRAARREDGPMTVDDALSQMELVGHDFFLFVNEENNKPSVVYRRHAFDYGLISLAEDAEA